MQKKSSHRISCKKFSQAIISLIVVVSLMGPIPSQGAQGESNTGNDFIEKVSWGDGKVMDVWLHLATDDYQTAPFLFVIHGTKRDADRYFDQWKILARRYHFNLAVPAFSSQDFPGSVRFNLGNLIDKNGKKNPPRKWSFSLIPKIFQQIKKKHQLSVSNFSMYGHSAGAQFVHRFVMAMPKSQLDYAIAANAGWYTLPTYAVNWPYGLGGAHIKREMLDLAFRKKLILLLGEKDTDPQHRYLRRTKEAMMQGPHRLARGKFFFMLAKKIARRQKKINHWELRTVPNAGHNNALMAEPAARLFDELWRQ